jgi:hypothetical protein
MSHEIIEDLSPGAREIWTRVKEGSERLSDILTKSPALIEAVDEYVAADRDCEAMVEYTCSFPVFHHTISRRSFEELHHSNIHTTQARK